MEFKQLDRTEPISSKRCSIFTPSPVEKVRTQIVRGTGGRQKSILIRTFKDKKRVSIYRGNTKVVALEIKEDLSDEEILKEIKREILSGRFDYEITEGFTLIQKTIKYRGRLKKTQKAEEALRQGLNVSIEELDLSRRIKTALGKLNINTSDELWNVNIWDLLLTRGLYFGNTSAGDLRAYFQKHGRELDETEPSSYKIRDLPK
jgi:hypothetical protein